MQSKIKNPNVLRTQIYIYIVYIYSVYIKYITPVLFTKHKCVEQWELVRFALVN